MIDWRDVGLHTGAGLILFGVIVLLAKLSPAWAAAVSVSGGIYIREVTQFQKARRLSFLRGWLLGGNFQKHAEWAVPAAVLIAVAGALAP